MAIPSFVLNQDLASLLITLAAQSILVSFIGIAVFKFFTGRYFN